MDARELVQYSIDLVSRSEELDANDPACANYAFRCLQEMPPVSSDAVLELIERCAVNPALIAHAGHEQFGEPSMIIAEKNGWIAEVLSWRDMVTSIHEHSNYGAFKTLSGERLHFGFEFLQHLEHQAELDNSVKLGQLSCIEMSILKPGTATRIDKRANFIHCIWPIDRVATTFVFRRQGPNDSWGYFPRMLNYDVRLAEKHTEKRLRYLLELKKYSEVKFVNVLKVLFEQAPMAVSIYLVTLLGISKRDSYFEDLISVTRKRSLAFANALADTAENNKLFEVLLEMRRQAATPAQQKKLAFAFYSKILDEAEVEKLFALMSDRESVAA